MGETTAVRPVNGPRAALHDGGRPLERPWRRARPRRLRSRRRLVGVGRPTQPNPTDTCRHVRHDPGVAGRIRPKMYALSVCSFRPGRVHTLESQSAVGLMPVFDRPCMHLYALYAFALKGKWRKKDELPKRLHTLHTKRENVRSCLLLSGFSASVEKCIQTAYRRIRNAYKPVFRDGIVKTMPVIRHCVQLRKCPPSSEDKHVFAAVIDIDGMSKTGVQPNQTRRAAKRP